MSSANDKAAPSKNDPPDPPQDLKTYAKALKNSRFKPKVQMTPILNSYLQMRNHANRHNDNMIELTFSRQDSGDTTTPEFPSLEVVATYLFEILKINQTDAIEIDHFSSRSKKRILLRDGVNIDQHKLYMPDTYKGYIVNVERTAQAKTRILFRNVPIDCPEVELINLCNTYGSIEGNITYQFMNVPTENKGNIRMRTSNRVAYVVLEPGKNMKNFYWLGGLQNTSKDTKITVIHHGQTQQCANCLLTEEEGCPAMGVGKSCRDMKQPRTPLADYFKRLEEEDGFISLRTQARRYAAQQKGQAEEGLDAEDDREDVDYYEEMQGLNNPSNSPLHSAYEKVMRGPPASHSEPKTPEKQTPATPVVTTQGPLKDTTPENLVETPLEPPKDTSPETPEQKESPTPKDDNKESKEELTPAKEDHKETTAESNDNKTPTTKENNIEQCINLVLNIKNRNNLNKDVTTQAAESLAVFFNLDCFQKLDDGSLWIEEATIFPSISRADLDNEQTAILDRILDPMEIVWSRKYKAKIRISKKSKRTRDGDSPRSSPPPKNAKSEK